MSISVVIRLVMCVITSYNALNLNGLAKLVRVLHFIYIFKNIFEDGFYMCARVCVCKSSIQMQHRDFLS